MSDPIPLGSRPARTMRVVMPVDAPALDRDEAVEAARETHAQAKAAYFELLGAIGGFRLRSLVKGGETVTRGVLKGTRSEAQDVVTAALALLAAVDATLEVVERWERR